MEPVVERGTTTPASSLSELELFEAYRNSEYRETVCATPKCRSHVEEESLFCPLCWREMMAGLNGRNA